MQVTTGGLGGLSPPGNITGGLEMDLVPQEKTDFSPPPLFVIRGVLLGLLLLLASPLFFLQLKL